MIWLGVAVDSLGGRSRALSMTSRASNWACVWYVAHMFIACVRYYFLQGVGLANGWVGGLVRLLPNPSLFLSRAPRQQAAFPQATFSCKTPPRPCPAQHTKHMTTVLLTLLFFDLLVLLPDADGEIWYESLESRLDLCHSTHFCEDRNAQSQDCSFGSF